MTVTIHQGDCRQVLATLPDESVHCVVTSPPYFGLRDYGTAGQIGLEANFRDYIETMGELFRQIWRVLREDGTLWLNLGDSYNSGGNPVGEDTIRSSTLQGGKSTQANSRRSFAKDLPPKNLLGIPWRVALTLQANGWYLRQDIIWSKPNPMPESVTDRCTKAHEYIFLLSKSERYYYDAEAIAEPVTFSTIARLNNSRGFLKKSGNKERKDATERGCPQTGVAGSIPWEGSMRNKRSVWEIATQPFSEAHFATFPPALIEPCILAGCPNGGTVLDPFGGSGTTGLVADRLGRNAILIELNPDYAVMAERRIKNDGPLFAQVERSYRAAD